MERKAVFSRESFSSASRLSRIGRAGVFARHGADRIGRRIDIDEAAVDLARRRAVAQRGHRIRKRRIDQDRAVNERHRVDVPVACMLGHDAFQERGALRPVRVLFTHQAIDLAYLHGRKRPREARGRAGREDQFRNRRKRLSSGTRRRGMEIDSQPMFAFQNEMGRMQVQRLEMAFEVGRGHEEIEPVPLWQQGLLRRALFHGHEGPAQEARKADAAEGRLEPARAN